LATCFGRDRPSSGQLRTIFSYSKNNSQWDPISFTLNFVEIWKFLPKIKTVKQCGKMVKLNLHALYSDLIVVCTLIVLCICQHQDGIRRRITVDRYFAYCVSCVYLGSHSCADQELFLYSPNHHLPVVFPVRIVIVD